VKAKVYWGVVGWNEKVISGFKTALGYFRQA
jgi:hypothetical protein